MAVPPKSHPAYRELVTGAKQPKLNCLALKILLGRTVLAAKQDPSPSNVDKQIGEVFNFFLKNEMIAQNDIAAIFGS